MSATPQKGISLDHETRQRVCQAVSQWLSLYAAEKKQPPTSADAWHSSLLQRLLDGKEPLPQPPPRRHSYPWYALIEDGHDTAIEVGEYPIAPGRLIIDQGMDWLILERGPYGPDGAAWYLVRCETNGQRFRVERGTCFAKQFVPDADPPIQEVPVPCWTLTRIDEGAP